MMRHHFQIIAFLLCTTLLLGGCNQNEDVHTNETTHRTSDTDEILDFTDNETKNSIEESQFVANRVTLPDDFVFPITDGSTSTTNLD